MPDPFKDFYQHLTTERNLPLPPLEEMRTLMQNPNAREDFFYDVLKLPAEYYDKYESIVLSQKPTFWDSTIFLPIPFTAPFPNITEKTGEEIYPQFFRDVGRSFSNQMSALLETSLIQVLDFVSPYGMLRQNLEILGVDLPNPLVEKVLDFGVTREKFFDEFHYTKAPEDRNFFTTLGEGYGSALGFILAIMAGRGAMSKEFAGAINKGILGKIDKVKPKGVKSVLKFLAGEEPVDMVVAGTFGALTEGQMGGLEAWKATGDIETYRKAYIPNAMLGTLEALPISRGLNRLNKAAQQFIKGMSKKYTWELLKQGGAEAIEEGVQEFIQGIGENMTAKELYDFNRDIMQGVWEGAGTGAIVGFTLGLGFGGISIKAKNNKYAQKLARVQAKEIIAQNLAAKAPFDASMNVAESLQKTDKSVEEIMEQEGIDTETLKKMEATTAFKEAMESVKGKVPVGTEKKEAHRVMFGVSGISGRPKNIDEYIKPFGEKVFKDAALAYRGMAEEVLFEGDEQLSTEFDDVSERLDELRHKEVKFQKGKEINVNEERIGVVFNKEKTIEQLKKDILNQKPARTIVRELFQNALDSKASNINVVYGASKEDPQQNFIRVVDDGIGMNPQEVRDNFLTIGNQAKGAEDIGGYGFAKLAFLFHPVRGKLTTIKDGQKTVMDFNAKDLIDNNVKLEVSKTEEPNRTKVDLLLPKSDYLGDIQKAVSEYQKYLVRDVNLTVQERYARRGFVSKFAGEKDEFETLPTEYKRRYEDIERAFPDETFAWKGNKIRIIYEKIPLNQNQKPSWAGGYEIETSVTNKGTPLDLDIGTRNLREKPYFRVRIDFQETVDPTADNYPFLKNRTELLYHLKRDIITKIDNMLGALNDEARKLERANIIDKIKNAMTVNGLKIVISNDTDEARKKIQKLIDKHKNIFDKVTESIKLFNKILEGSNEKKIEIYLTLDDAGGWMPVEDIRSLVGNMFAINPFYLYTVEVYQKSKLTNWNARKLSDWITHAFVHEYAHQWGDGHDTEFAYKVADLYGNIGHTNLNKLSEFINDNIYSANRNEFERAAKDVQEFGKSNAKTGSSILAYQSEVGRRPDSKGSISESSTESLLFQRGRGTGKSTYAEVIKEADITPNKTTTVKDFIKQLESRGFVNRELKVLADFLVQEIGDMEIIPANEHTIRQKLESYETGEIPKHLKGFYSEVTYKGKQRVKTQKPIIGINLDAKLDYETEVYETAIHEMLHGLTIKALRENRSFRNKINSLRNDVMDKIATDDIYLNHREEIDDALIDDEEFVAAVFSRTAPNLSQWMQNNEYQPRQTFMRRFWTFIRSLLTDKAGKRPSTFYDAFEVVMSQYTNTPSRFEMSSSELEMKDDTTADELYDRLEKVLMLEDADLDAVRTIRAIAEILELEDVEDPIRYVAEMELPELKNKLMNSYEILRRVAVHYQQLHDKFDTMDDYIDTMARRVYERANSLEKVPFVRMHVTIDRADDGLIEAAMERFEGKFLNESNQTVHNYIPKMKISEYLKYLSEMIGVDFELVSMDKARARYKEKNGRTGRYFPMHLAANKIKTRNELFHEALDTAGIIYLGTFADKNTVLGLIPKSPLDRSIFDKQQQEYMKMKRQMVPDLIIKLAQKEADNDFRELIVGSLNEAEGLNEFENTEDLKRYLNRLADVTGVPAVREGEARAKARDDYSKILKTIRPQVERFATAEPSYIGETIRAMLLDIKLGGRFTEEGFDSKLYDIENEESYNGIKSLKRVWEVHETTHPYLNTAELEELAKDTDGFSMVNGELMIDSGIFEAEKVADIPMKIDGKDVPLRKMLINEYGLPTTDGVVFYLKGNFDKIYYKLHGELNEGVIKAWITDTMLKDPLYVKPAFFAVTEHDPIGRYMIQNKLGLLISSTASKITRPSHGKRDRAKQTGKMEGEDLRFTQLNEAVETFQIPFKEIHRLETRKDFSPFGLGFRQTINANVPTEDNPGFHMGEWNEGMDILVKNLVNEFDDQLKQFDPAQLIGLLKEKIMTGKSPEERAVAEMLIDVVMTVHDAEYKELKDEYEVRKLEEDNFMVAQGIKRKLHQLRQKVIREEPVTGSKIANVMLAEPFLSKTLKNMIVRKADRILKFGVPAGWVVSYPDVGFLHNRESYIKDAAKFILMLETSPKDKKRYEELSRLAAQLSEEIIQLRFTPDAFELMKKAESDLEKVDAELEKFTETGLLEDYTEDDLNKLMNKIRDPEHGRLNHGWVIISQDVADALHLKPGDHIITPRVPGDSIMSVHYGRVGAILPRSRFTDSQIIMNSEYSQGIVGEDFDYDRRLVVGKSKMLSELAHKMLGEAIEGSLKKHKQVLPRIYDSVLGKISEPGSLDVRNHKFKDTLNPDVRLRFMQEVLGGPEDKDMAYTLFDVLGDQSKINDKFTKEVGLPVNRKVILTVFSQLGLTSTVEGEHINVKHKDKNKNYVALQNEIHDTVDIPNNTNTFFYSRDRVKLFDLQYGTNFQEMEYGEEIVSVIDQVNSWLFEMIKWDLDKFETVNNSKYNDFILKIRKQQIRNYYLDTGQMDKLFEEYKRNYRATHPVDDPADQFHLSTAEDYISHMALENSTSASPSLRVIQNIDMKAMPDLRGSKTGYLRTAQQVVDAFFEMNANMKKAYDRVMTDESKIKNNNRLVTRKILVDKAKKEGRKQVQMFYMTSFNEKLHKLKLLTIALMNPVDQSPRNTYWHDAYNEINQQAFPILLRNLFENNNALLFKNFKGKIPQAVIQMSDKSAVLIFRKSPTGQLQIVHKKGDDKTYFTPKHILYPEMTFHSDLAKRIQADIFGEMFRKEDNRLTFNKLLSFGSKNTLIDDRIKMAADMLNRELPKYSQMDQSIFFVSLLGKAPNYEGIRPHNYITPDRKTANTHGQEKLLNLLLKLNVPIARRFKNALLRVTASVYDGPDFTSATALRNLTEAAPFDKDVQREVWFHAKKPDIRDDVKDIPEGMNIKDFFSTIFGLAKESKVVLTRDPEKILSRVVSFKPHKTTTAITGLDAVNASLPEFQTEIMKDVTPEMEALARMQELLTEMKGASGVERSRDLRIKDYTKQIVSIIKGSEKQSAVDVIAKRIKKDKSIPLVHNTAFKKKDLPAITKIIEENPYDMKIEEVDINVYRYMAGTNKIYEPVKFQSDEALIDEMLDDLNITDKRERLRHKIALEYHKRYSVDYPKYLSRIVTYIDMMMANNPDHIYKTEISFIRNRLNSLRKRMMDKAFRYYPRVYKTNLFRSAYKSMIEAQVEWFVDQRIEQETRRMEQGLDYDERFTKENRANMIRDYKEKGYATIRFDNYGDYLHSFELHRTKDEDLPGNYITDSFVPHQKHHKDFWNLIREQLVLLESYIYEAKAVDNGVKPGTIKRMRLWYGLESNSKRFRQRSIERDKMKPGDIVEFYTMRLVPGDRKEQKINGIVERVDKENVYLRFDRAALINIARERIKKVNRIFDSIQMNMKYGKVPATRDQLHELKSLADEGFAEYTGKENKEEAATKIHRGWNELLNDLDNWRRFRIKDIYHKAIEGDNIVFTTKIKKEINFKGIDKAVETGNMMMSIAMLGSPGAGWKNRTDAMWAVSRDFRPWNFIGSGLFNKDVTRGLNFGDLNPKDLVKLRGALLKQLESENNFEGYRKISKAESAEDLVKAFDSQDKMISAFVQQYIIENGYLESKFEAERVGEAGDYIEDWGGFWNMVKKILDTGSSQTVGRWFQKAEKNVRIYSAIIYAYKAIALENQTDPKLIRAIIDNGVARTQSLYEMMYRRLGESKSYGRMWFKFSQYQSFQYRAALQTLKHGKKYLPWYAVFTPKVKGKDGKIHGSWNEVDPNVYNRLAVDFIIDSWGLALETIFPGFRAGKPVTTVPLRLMARLLAVHAMQGFKWDDWDDKEILFSILSIIGGLGMSIPITVMANLVDDIYDVKVPVLTSDNELSVWQRYSFPINPRMAMFGNDLVDAVTSEIDWRYMTKEDWLNPDKWEFKQAWYKMGRYEKFLLGGHYIFPTYRKYYTEKEAEFQSRDILKRSAVLLDRLTSLDPRRNILIPVLNTLDRERPIWRK